MPSMTVAHNLAVYHWLEACQLCLQWLPSPFFLNAGSMAIIMLCIGSSSMNHSSGSEELLFSMHLLNLLANWIRSDTEWGLYLACFKVRPLPCHVCVAINQFIRFRLIDESESDSSAAHDMPCYRWPRRLPWFPCAFLSCTLCQSMGCSLAFAYIMRNPLDLARAKRLHTSLVLIRFFPSNLMSLMVSSDRHVALSLKLRFFNKHIWLHWYIVCSFLSKCIMNTANLVSLIF